MPLMHPLLISVVLLIAMAAVGCGRRDAESAYADSVAAADSAAMAETEGTDTASAPSTGEPAATAADASSRPLTVEDIDRWQKGMTGEMQAVQEAATKMKAARTQEDTLSAMMAPQETETAAAGARAAGLGEERYKFVRSKLSDVVKYLVPLELGIDTSNMPQDQREEFRTQRDAYLQQTAWAVPSAVIEALRPRAAELRKQDLELVGARLKGAGLKPTS
jgi:hypothetical protein